MHIFLMSFFLQKVTNSIATNCSPLSLMIFSGNPKISLILLWMVVAAVAVLNGIANSYLISLYFHTVNMNSMHWTICPRPIAIGPLVAN